MGLDLRYKAEMTLISNATVMLVTRLNGHESISLSLTMVHRLRRVKGSC